MSDDYDYIIPEEPGAVPEDPKAEVALNHFHSIAPEADAIKSSVSEHLRFIDCGGNFGDIRCPSCGALIELSAWKGWMGGDFQGKGMGFRLSKRALPCCGTLASLHELAYEWPQGFARFQIKAKNPNTGKLSVEQCRTFEELLGCTVRVIYAHI
jgi:hypothetical protein